MSELIERIDAEASALYEGTKTIDVFNNGPLLRLLADCKAALSQQEAEPVAYESRILYSHGWGDWKPCSREAYQEFSVPGACAGRYPVGVRKLYTDAPKPAPLPQPKLSSIELTILEAHECERCVGTGAVDSGLSIPNEFTDCPECRGKRYIFPQPVASVPQKEHDLQDVRCGCCGYMTYHREHMGCIRAARPSVPQGLEEFILKHRRPMVLHEGNLVIEVIALDDLRAWIAASQEGV